MSADEITNLPESIRELIRVANGARVVPSQAFTQGTLERLRVEAGSPSPRLKKRGKALRTGSPYMSFVGVAATLAVLTLSAFLYVRYLRPMLEGGGQPTAERPSGLPAPETAPGVLPLQIAVNGEELGSSLGRVFPVGVPLGLRFTFNGPAPDSIVILLPPGVEFHSIAHSNAKDTRELRIPLERDSATKAAPVSIVIRSKAAGVQVLRASYFGKDGKLLVIRAIPLRFGAEKKGK